MRLVLALIACGLLAGCDHLYGGVDGGAKPDRLIGASR
jgi:hypothetical protein